MKYQLIPIRDECTKKISWAIKLRGKIFSTYESKFEANNAIKKLNDADLQLKF